MWIKRIFSLYFIICYANKIKRWNQITRGFVPLLYSEAYEKWMGLRSLFQPWIGPGNECEPVADEKVNNDKYQTAHQQL